MSEETEWDPTPRIVFYAGRFSMWRTYINDQLLLAQKAWRAIPTKGVPSAGTVYIGDVKYVSVRNVQDMRGYSAEKVELVWDEGWKPLSTNTIREISQCYRMYKAYEGR